MSEQLTQPQSDTEVVPKPEQKPVSEREAGLIRKGLAIFDHISEGTNKVRRKEVEGLDEIGKKLSTLQSSSEAARHSDPGARQVKEYTEDITRVLGSKLISLKQNAIELGSSRSQVRTQLETALVTIAQEPNPIKAFALA